MLIKLIHDTSVRYPKDSILEVTDDEGKRLIAFGNAIKTEAKAEPKKTKKKKGE